MRTIVIMNDLPKTKTAVAVGVTRMDRAMIDGEWRAAADLPHGQVVERSNHFGRHINQAGETVRARFIDNQIAVLRIIDIRIMEVARMTPEDFQALGYADHAAYMADFGKAYGSKLWYMRIDRPESENDRG